MNQINQLSTPGAFWLDPLGIVRTEGRNIREAFSTKYSSRQRLFGRVSQLGKCSRVPHRQMAAFYSAADLFVLGSAHESTGYSLLEACACGAIPVVTSIPSFQAITDKGAVGVLWPHGDSSACAQALVDAAHRDLTEERQHVLHHFERHLSWPVVGTRAREIYEDVRAHRRS